MDKKEQYLRWASPFSPFCLYANGSLLFVSSATNRQTTNFLLHDKLTVNKLKMITWASVFCLKPQQLYMNIIPFFVYIYIYIYTYIETAAYIYTEDGTKGKCQLLFFGANGKLKKQISVFLLQTEMENGSMFSLVGSDTVIDDCCFSKGTHPSMGNTR
jgi:hypothetical protein